MSFKSEFKKLELIYIRLQEEKKELQALLDKERADREAERRANTRHVAIAITNSRGIGSKTEFKIKWEDNSESWEPRSYVEAPALYKEWRKKRKLEAVREHRERRKIEAESKSKGK